MNRRSYLAAVAGGVAWIVAPVLWAQGVEPCTIGMNHFIGYGVSSVKSAAPFSATGKTTWEQRLGDGNILHGVTHGRLARTTTGKTFSETPQPCERGVDGKPHARVSVYVYDPATKTSWSWQAGGIADQKVVRVFHQPEIAPKKMTPEQQAVMLEQRKRAQAMQPPKDEFKTEKLGSRSFNGVECDGVRRTQTVPAGEWGNELPLVIVNETWTSRQLGLTMYAVNDDPRNGKSTYEYEEFSLGEPDAALFTPPADYKFEEVHPRVDGE